MKTHLWSALSGVMVLCLAFSVAVQYNDPDPLPWMGIYLAALLCTVAQWRPRVAPSVGRGWTWRGWPWGIAVVAAVWALRIGRELRLGVPLATALGDWQMHSQGSEEAREIGGLVMVAGWMAVVGWRGGPKKTARGMNS